MLHLLRSQDFDGYCFIPIPCVCDLSVDRIIKHFASILDANGNGFADPSLATEHDDPPTEYNKLTYMSKTHLRKL